MSYTDVQICNLALGMLGGAGDQVDATGQISSLSDTDKVSTWCNTYFPSAVEQVIIDMMAMEAPLRETVKLAELDDELTSDDVTISDISVGAAPGYEITVTTDEAHEKSTGNTVVLKGIDGDGNISSLNGTTYTITVVDSTSFTLDSTTGSADYDYTEDSGIVSRAPEMGPWTYAFDLPSDCLAVYRVMDESWSSNEDTRKEYRFETILNRDGDGHIILTNDLTNYDGDGIYLEYVINQSDESLFALATVMAIATYLAHLLAPVVGRNTQVATFFLNKYREVALPDAVTYHQSQLNNTARKRKDFRGGRTSELPDSL